MRNKKTLLAILWNVLILFFCLVNLSDINSVQKVAFPHIDKVVHFVFYTTASFLWLWALKKSTLQKQLVFVLVFLSLSTFGLLIEFLQDILPTKRAFEWLDVACNIAGVFAGTIAYLIYKKTKPHQV